MTNTEATRPKVLIVGAGLGGLALGAILERSQVDYEIYERSPTISPIGSTIGLSAGVMPMMVQLGLYEKLMAIGKVAGFTRIYRESHEYLGAIENAGMEDRFHYQTLIMSRPMLHQMLFEQIPSHKIHFGKRMLLQKETETGIQLQFSDNSTVEGHILVGADGANSAVRQNLYKQLKDVLPDSDKLPLKYSSVCVVGQTGPLDPEKVTFLKDEMSNAEIVMCDSKPFACAAFPTAQNTICWMVVEFLDKESSKIHDTFRASEWGPEAAEAMVKEDFIRKIVFPGAGKVTMGELMDKTPKELMSKVMLEEKMFKTWGSGRAVLLGDACHKMSPAAGQGAVNAMLDAIVLANYIESLHSTSLKDIEAAFQTYRDERYDRAKAAVGGSAAMMHLSAEGLLGTIVRKVVLSPPKWLKNIIRGKQDGYRPQIAFLPAAEDHGSVKSPYQPSLHLPGSSRPVAV